MSHAFDLSQPLYHGSRHAKLKEFRPSTTGEFGPGVYLTSYEPTAVWYAQNAKGPDEPTVHVVSVHPKNPFHVTKSHWVKLTERMTPREVQAALKRRGYDSIIGIGNNGYEWQLVVFDPKDIAVLRGSKERGVEGIFRGLEATTPTIVDAVLALTAPPIEWTRVEDRESVADAVWAMYESSYARIGLIASGPEQLLTEYDTWWVAHEGDVPRAFRVAKSTPFGLKIGLSGTDGSREGRTFLKATMGRWLAEPGVYCEVSHRMEDLAREGGAPVVCSTDAPSVLRKPVIPVDAVHYQRNIEPIGLVTKVIVGRPLSVPVTSFELPSCPKYSSSERLSGFGSEASDRVDLLEALDSLMPWED